jgi:hypothetical protein
MKKPRKKAYKAAIHVDWSEQKLRIPNFAKHRSSKPTQGWTQRNKHADKK